MKRIFLVATASLVLGMLILVYSQTRVQRLKPNQTVVNTQEVSFEKQFSTQQRVNLYFHNDVLAKVKPCWGNVKGKGSIGLKYTYIKSGDRWISNGVAVDQSSLPSEQSKVALRCMSQAVRDSSFAALPAENLVKEFVLNWTWPVPFPTNATELARAMFAAKPNGGGSGGGGCDGHGALAKCFTCGQTNGVMDCKKVCVGAETCTITFEQKGSKMCTEGRACASGGPFGLGGATRGIQ
jgi:hypothetical protein